jgi:hypothetical protein
MHQAKKRRQGAKPTYSLYRDYALKTVGELSFGMSFSLRGFCQGQEVCQHERTLAGSLDAVTVFQQQVFYISSELWYGF